MVRIDAQAGTGAEAGLLEPFAVGAFQRNRLEQDHHHQIQTPNLKKEDERRGKNRYNLVTPCIQATLFPLYLIRLPKAVYSAHFALLVRIGQNAHGGFLLRDAVDEILPAVVGDVLAQFPQQTGGPLLFGFRVFVLEME